jgi:hypothetical protein
MVEHAETPGSQFNQALSALTKALEDAATAAQALQLLVPTVEDLTRLIGELEARMDRARELLAQEAPRLGAEPVRPVEFQPREESRPTAPVEVASEEQPAAYGGNACYLLEVRAISGPLDLKTVDNSVNASADVADVALLDYDGRRATLKVWFEGAADLPAARASLRDSLQRHLAGQPAEISLERSEEPAA